MHVSIAQYFVPLLLSGIFESLLATLHIT